MCLPVFPLVVLLVFLFTLVLLPFGILLSIPQNVSAVAFLSCRLEDRGSEGVRLSVAYSRTVLQKLL